MKRYDFRAPDRFQLLTPEVERLDLGYIGIFSDSRIPKLDHQKFLSKFRNNLETPILLYSPVDKWCDLAVGEIEILDGLSPNLKYGRLSYYPEEPDKIIILGSRNGIFSDRDSFVNIVMMPIRNGLIKCLYCSNADNDRD